MKAKAARKRLAAKFTEDGLPKDVNDWQEADWADLWNCMQETRTRIAARHAKVHGKELFKCWYCKTSHAPENWCPEKQEAWRKSK
jgi:hypothetical protein